MWLAFSFFAGSLVAGGVLAAILWCLLRWWSRTSAAAQPLSRTLVHCETIAFFHPYAYAGGGGERVLWCAIKAVQQRHQGVHCVVFTGDVGVTPEAFLQSARTRFGVELQADMVHFVFLKGRCWVDAMTWPRLTLLGQSIGSMLLGWEALCQFRPDVFVDSMGYAFTFPIFAVIGGCRVGCYVHYPTISTDMLNQVRSRDVSVCNDAAIARSWYLSRAKLVYYRAFAALYGFVGRFAEVVFVNSSWTHGHITSLWRVPKRTTTVFPPCDTEDLAQLSLERQPQVNGDRLLVSLAQFRPEKNHALQLCSFARFLRSRQSGDDRVRFVLAGGCRDAGDQGRVQKLRELCNDLGLVERDELGSNEAWDVWFRLNVPLTDMKALLNQADVGMHTMREEHFGINVVEFMAAGVVPLAHDSGGPAMDIVTPWNGQTTGRLASDEESYAVALHELFALEPDERRNMAAAARDSVCNRFSQTTFEELIANQLVAPLRKGNASPKRLS